ncbi:MAG: DinB family protein [Candidatus Eisenbacteria bacterium]|uniref:DinB family protein n=1 Tax=Eiseniibacteriota bacterium TaxID=2212470 RepID=A0A538U6R9_UNCEI|nr:MAG: DinB family protein [Candidatus Eisenbacteria bacterium]
MKTKWWVLSLVGMTLAIGALRVAGAADEPTGYKADMISWIKDMKGVRSQGEVFLHVAGANYGIPAMMGVAPPQGFQLETYEQSMTKKADIQKALKDSFAHLETALANTSETDMDKEVTLFGQKMTKRHAYMLLLSHVHEHLGQSIAYARSNGIVPPWTAKQQAAVRQEAEKKKDAK